eukprot:g10168.t1
MKMISTCKPRHGGGEHRRSVSGYGGGDERVAPEPGRGGEYGDHPNPRDEDWSWGGSSQQDTQRQTSSNPAEGPEYHHIHGPEIRNSWRAGGNRYAVGGEAQKILPDEGGRRRELHEPEPHPDARYEVSRDAGENRTSCREQDFAGRGSRHKPPYGRYHNQASAGDELLEDLSGRSGDSNRRSYGGHGLTHADGGQENNPVEMGRDGANHPEASGGRQSNATQKKPESLNEALVKSPKDMLLFSKKARQVDYKPYTIKEYRESKPTGYVELGKLQPDLYTDELVAKRANAERMKEFSANLRKINSDITASARRGTSTTTANSRARKGPAQDSRSKGLAFASRIPLPKKRPTPRKSASSAEPPSDLGARRRAAGRRANGSSNPNEVEWESRELTELEALEREHDEMRRKVQAARSIF